MATFNKILCPVDFDDNSIDALRLAIDLARQNNAKVYLLHVVPPMDPLVVSAPIVFARDQERARSELDKAAGKYLAGIDHEVLQRVGHAAAEIVAAGGAVGADLVVMATHGRKGVSHLVLGSVAEKVVRESTCPVLVVRNRNAAQMAA
jgi:universal stress protein A